MCFELNLNVYLAIKPTGQRFLRILPLCLKIIISKCFFSSLLLRFDASLTCPEPWSHVNKTIKLLTVKVCHLTQFSFLWSFYAQNGLVLFDKNNSRKSVTCSYVCIRVHMPFDHCLKDL